MSAIRIEITPNVEWFKYMTVKDRMNFLQVTSDWLEDQFGGPVRIHTDYTLLEPHPTRG